MLLSSFSATAQWLSQSFVLRPGWNAIYTHVDASYQSLDALVPDANGPLAEVWLWKPTFSTMQFVDSPYTNTTPGSQWSVWTSARGDTDTLSRLVGNGAYLVLNRSAGDFTWTVKGRPAPPSYVWTTTGLNFLGFSTPPASPPSFASFLAPAPELDLSRSLENSARVFRYGGGELGSTNPVEVLSISAASTPVARGQAYWVRGSTNYYNRYYGPVEVVLQNSAGIHYGDTLGSYSLRLRNLTTTQQTITLSLLPSETPPSGQTEITGPPQLLVRGTLDPNTLTYGHAVLTSSQFTLAPAGQPGSDLPVVLGVNRLLMTGPAGSLQAGILRLTDAAGRQQTDLPVSATVADDAGLWVGQASISQVGQYLVTYPTVDSSVGNTTAQINAAAESAGLPPNGAEIPGAQWIARETNSSRAYSAIASSLDGRVIVTAVAGGPLYVSVDAGVTWNAKESNRHWSDVYCSAEGSVMLAGAFNGAIHRSTDRGATWTETPSGVQSWIGVAGSADSTRLAAVAQNGSLHLSLNGGASWTPQSAAQVRNWSDIAMSADGQRLLAAVNPGPLVTSSDGGLTWTERESSRAWSSVALSADGMNLVATVNGGQIFTSSDAGVRWTARADNAAWKAVSSSTDGLRLAAVVAGGQLYTSEDSGVTWTGREPARAWTGLASTGDATRLATTVEEGAIYTLQRAFASYTVDATTGLVQDQNGAYISTGVNTNLARVSRPFPLRLILHNQTGAGAGQISLLQRVYIGSGVNLTNTVIATSQALLDPAQLASARRITATHLPFSLNNSYWTVAGNFRPGTALKFGVNTRHDDHASNPFLHTFHPDHDNLDPAFESALARGRESYDISRAVRLTFSNTGTDFASLTAGAQSRSGTYEETLTIGAREGYSRDFRMAGSFSLQLISPVPTLSTP